jgi:hypothetical protein
MEITDQREAPTVKFSTTLLSSQGFLTRLADVRIAVDPLNGIKNPVHAKTFFPPVHHDFDY